jgi:hypothetical protein
MAYRDNRWLGDRVGLMVRQERDQAHGWGKLQRAGTCKLAGHWPAPAQNESTTVCVPLSTLYSLIPLSPALLPLSPPLSLLLPTHPRLAAAMPGVRT